MLTYLELRQRRDIDSSWKAVRGRWPFCGFVVSGCGGKRNERKGKVGATSTVVCLEKLLCVVNVTRKSERGRRHEQTEMTRKFRGAVTGV